MTQGKENYSQNLQEIFDFNKQSQEFTFDFQSCTPKKVASEKIVQLQDYTFIDAQSNDFDSTKSLDLMEVQAQVSSSMANIPFLLPQMEFYGEMPIMVYEKKQEVASWNHNSSEEKKLQNENELPSIEHFQGRGSQKCPHRIQMDQQNMGNEINNQSANIQINPQKNQIKLLRRRRLLKSAKTNQRKTKKPSNKNYKRISKKKQRKVKPKKIIGLDAKELKREKNQTKNIVKNFGKEIIRFVNINNILITRILTQLNSNLSYQALDSELQQNRKNKMSKIEHLRQLWTDETIGKQMRIISQTFLRKECYHWIFFSRVQDYKSPLKYKNRLEAAIVDPWNFLSLKWP